MHLSISSLMLSLLPSFVSATSPPRLYSIDMALSIISRNQGILTNSSDKSSWLRSGFTQKTFSQLLTLYPSHPSSPLISSHILTSVTSILPTILSPQNATLLPLDRLSSGDAMLTLYATTGLEQYRTGFSALRSSIDLQPRNPEGGLQYFVYPGWSYLDGMYSLSSFYATYNKDYDRWNATARADLVLQLGQLWNRTRKADTGLLVHGFDDNRNASWADPVTGASPIVWGRSLGWYVMALVDVVELFAERAGDVRELLVERFEGVMEGVVRVRDKGSGVWWQVMDQGGREGNYLESSASAMFVYAMLKGVRLGYLGDGVGSNWTEVAVEGYRYIVDKFVVDKGNGTLEYDRTVSVCSLNSTASYEYYVNQPIAYNSVLGTNAFILASLEYERLKQSQ